MRKHFNTPLFLVLFLLAAITPSFVQPLYAETSDGPYYIRSITYAITGITQPFALRNAADIKEGELLANKAALDQYINIKTQLLLNNRVLEKAEIQYTLGKAEADGRIPVDVTVKTTDTWNIIALPYFKYDSSKGLEISAKARDYNFLGTMQPLKIDLGYEIDREPLNNQAFDKGAFFVDIDSNFPFRAWNLDWNFDFDHYFGYTYKYGFEYENKTGLSLSIPIQSTTLTISAYQGVSINQENADKYKPLYGDRYADYWYLSNWLRADWTIPTSIKVDGFSKVLYIPSLQIKQNYRPFGDIGEERIGPVTTIAHKLAFGRVDWIGNFRRGLDISLSNTNDYNLYKTSWNKSVQAELIGHYPLFSFAELSGRIQGAYYFDEPDSNGASPLRGILDSAISAQYGIYANFDVPIRVIKFVPSEWFGKRWLRIFDIEQQWTPFIDTALVKDPVHNLDFSSNDMLITSGAEVVTFPLFIRSFYLRISVGFNLKEALRIQALPDGDNREIFIGLGHHY
uniref:Bacterial surface antigen (D15) domain-containing protein n=1 Tax=Gracilinema caldarium TaxID=215591 RepID=A0A7C3IFY1_9SPIR